MNTEKKERPNCARRFRWIPFEPNLFWKLKENGSVRDLMNLFFRLMSVIEINRSTDKAADNKRIKCLMNTYIIS